ncbi:MAG: hypothetical protein K2O74_04455, partial [Eubacteriales bacterium]|nr:hypothetical protein [Eubacteriales bacterium]
MLFQIKKRWHSLASVFMPLRFPTARRILALRELPAQPTEKALSRRDNEAFTQFFLEKIAGVQGTASPGAARA